MDSASLTDDRDKDKRVLWLLNHETLRLSEVPLLQELGFEVFLPKLYDDTEDNKSASVSYDFDGGLSIPPEALAILNAHNFYSSPIDYEVRQVINRYFGTVITAAFIDMTRRLVQHFKGRILVRAFGHAGTTNYFDVFEQYGGRSFMRSIFKIQDRFWLASGYRNIRDNEPDFFQRRDVYLPLGLPEKFFAIEDSWIGTDKKIFFVCPRIKSSPTYFGKIYDEFKRDFGDFPYAVGGAQPIEVDDPNVLGKIPRDAFDRHLQECAVMYYHSREPRHIHYHPLEAIVVGQPLLFMEGGMLDLLSKSPDMAERSAEKGERPVVMAGMCRTTEEARQKIKRIFAGDTVLIEAIRNSQKSLLECFSHAFNRRIWTENFKQGVMRVQPAALPQPKQKIAVMLPIGYRGGSINGAKNIAKMIHIGSRQAGEPVDVVFSCLADFYDVDTDFGDLLALGIEVRETRWRNIDKDEAANALHMGSHDPGPLLMDHYMVPKDGVCDFADCSFWMLVSDRTLWPIVPLRPHAVMVYDYLQRYVPEIFGTHHSVYEISQIETDRQADFLLTTTPQTRMDAIHYAGVYPGKVVLSPMEFDPLDLPAGPNPMEQDYFIWTTNITVHKNHMRALEALEIYYQELGGTLNCVVTGYDTEKLNIRKKLADPQEYVAKIRERIRRARFTKSQFQVPGHLSTQSYVTMLSHASFLFHAAQADNGTFSVIEAAFHGVPSLSTDYPQMRYIDERFGVKATFTDPFSARAMAQALKGMETGAAAKRALLPTRAELARFSYRQVAPEFWQLVRGML